MKEQRLLTINETLARAGVSRFTLYRDSKSGKIEPIYFGKNVRYREEDVEAYTKEKSSSKLVNFYKNGVKKHE